VRIKGPPILPRFLSTIANATVAFSMPTAHTSRGAYQAFRRFDELQALTQKQLQDTVRHAIRGKYVVIAGSGKRRQLVLTHKGKRLINKEALENLKPLRPPVWNKKWHMVMFDIPEIYKNRRDSFSAGLKRMVFVPIQKSCFIFPFPCFEEFEVLAEFHQVRSFSTFLLIESLEKSHSLMRRFKL